jgi:O-antigen/teichoic acid export membrane protein
VERLSRVVARNSAFSMGAQMIMKVLSFGFSVLIVRNLGAESYGQYAGVLAFGAVFVFIGDLGLSPFAVREVARYHGAQDSDRHTAGLYGNVLVLRILLSTVAACLMLGTAVLTGRSPEMIGAIGIGCIGLMMYGIQGSSEAILTGLERLDVAAGAKVLNQTVFVIFGGAMLLLGTGYYGLVLANLVGVALMTVFCWHAVRKLGIGALRPDPRVWLTLLRAGIPFGVIGFTLGLSYKFDSVLLNIFRGDTETGYYNAAYNLVFSAVLISNVLNTSLYPSLVRQAKATPQLLPRVYERAFRYLLLLSMPIAVGAWAAADRLVPFLFRDGFGPTIDALHILIWVVPLMFASEFLGYVVVIQGRESRVARAIVVSTSLNVVANLLLVPHFGLLGASIMTVVTEMILVTQYVWVLHALLRSFEWRRAFLRPALASVAMGLGILALRDAPLLATVVIAAVSYTVLLFVLRVLGREEVQFVLSLRRPAAADHKAAAA